MTGSARFFVPFWAFMRVPVTCKIQGLKRGKVELVVNAAIAKGIYVLIDWHDHHAEWSSSPIGF